MSADPESLSLAAKVIGAVTIVVSPFVAGYKWVDTKLDGKANKKDVEEEIKRHRDYFVKVFEKMDAHQQSDTENFKEITRVIHQNHAELLREIGRKEDR
jgi:hypothetical protein